MKQILALLFIFYFVLLNAQVKVCSWNLCDMGKSKSAESIEQMAHILKEFDVVALQEIVAGAEGAKAVIKLVDELETTGFKWSYSISNPTIGNKQKRERYAFLWKPSKVKQIGKPWLDNNFEQEIEREPYLCTFQYEEKNFTLVNFHAITKRLQPETEIKYFKFYPSKYPTLNLIFAGDFNCPQNHTVFGPLKRMGFSPALTNIKTTLKQTCVRDCTASEFDNFFADANKIEIRDSGAISFYKTSATFEAARKLSDHLPIWMTFKLK
jgi:endonuclease/exonuclease/phosphatase family metal-dependent hydrolase